MVYNPWGHQESDTTECTCTHKVIVIKIIIILFSYDCYEKIIKQ